MEPNKPGTKPATPARRILIVDDENSISRVLAMVVQKYGSTVVVDSGNKAIEQLKHSHFDLILTDFEMEQGSGLDLLAYMDEHSIKTPTIMITAFGTKDLIIKTMKYHVFGFIEKPFTQENVVTLVQQALAAREQSENLNNLAILGTTVGEIVHEIANPLAVLDFRVSLMKEEGQNDQADKMGESLDRIKKIIVSTRQEIKSEKPQKFLTFKLEKVLKEAKEEFEQRAQKKNVHVALVGNFDLILNGDQGRIRQVVVNLVNNAIDAAAEQNEKWVKVEIDTDAQKVNLLVTDSGNGIPLEARKKLFEPLFSTKGANGTGFGLSIVRKIATEHGGNVHLNTDNPNTQFVLSLPRI